MTTKTNLMYRAFTVMLFLCAPLVILPQVIGANEPVTVVSTVAPKYPAIASTANAKGIVVVELSIDPRGVVISSKVLDGHPLLRRVTEEASRMWKFNPVSDGNETRSARITFDFDIQFLESTEARDVTNYVPPYRMEITRKIATIAPLTRINGQIPEETCPLHSEIMKLDVVPILYGLPESTQVFHNDDVVNLFRNAWAKLTHNETYDEASYKKFPYSNSTVGGGCMVGRERKAEILYCPKCRATEMKWRKKHPNEWPRVVAFIS